MRCSPFKLYRDEFGVLALFVAIGAFPVAGTIVAAVDLGLQGTHHSQIRDVVQTACSRVTAPFFASAPATDREAAAQAVLDRHLPDTALESATASYLAADAGAGLEIRVDGEIDSLVGGLTGSTSVAFTINCDGPQTSPAAASPALVFFDGFETPDVRDSGYSGWYVEPRLPGWRLISGPGAQINRDNTGDPLVYEGSQRIELDSDWRRGALPSPTMNTAIARPLNLEPGRYKLSYMFHRHPVATQPSDSEVLVYLDPDDGHSTMTNQIKRSATMDMRWLAESVEIDIAIAGNYLLTFAANGRSLGFGGNIDAVQLERLP